MRRPQLAWSLLPKALARGAVDEIGKSPGGVYGIGQPCLMTQRRDKRSGIGIGSNLWHFDGELMVN